MKLYENELNIMMKYYKFKQEESTNTIEKNYYQGRMDSVFFILNHIILPDEPRIGFYKYNVDQMEGEKNG